MPPSNEWYAVGECAEQAVDGSLHSGEIEESISKGLNQLTVGKFRAPGLRQALFAIEGTCQLSVGGGGCVSVIAQVDDRPKKGRSLELLSMDKRTEPIDESYRGLPDISDEFFDYTVTGNQPVAVRENPLREVLEMGAKTVDKSRELFPPGLIGPFSLETVYNPTRGFAVFEVSARIVAGTNLYPTGSPYSASIYGEPMSTGRCIARELKRGLERGDLNKTVF
jgi:hypothetical protein